MSLQEFQNSERLVQLLQADLCSDRASEPHMINSTAQRCQTMPNHHRWCEECGCVATNTSSVFFKCARQVESKLIMSPRNDEVNSILTFSKICDLFHPLPLISHTNTHLVLSDVTFYVQHLLPQENIQTPPSSKSQKPMSLNAPQGC